jgi:hypothetical protein
MMHGEGDEVEIGKSAAMALMVRHQPLLEVGGLGPRTARPHSGVAARRRRAFGSSSLITSNSMPWAFTASAVGWLV